MATTTADTPFLWGSAGERLTPEQIKSRRAVADALVKSGTEGTPIKHWTQGVNRVAQALLGGYESGQIDRLEKANADEDRRLMSRGLQLYFTPPGSADNPASGSRPVSLDASQPVNGGATPPAGVAPFSAAPGPQPGQIPGSAPILPSDGFSRPATTSDLAPEQKALLAAINYGEAPDGRYDVRYTAKGGVPFELNGQHPGIPEVIAKGPNAGRTSTAAGRYQFLKSTWDKVPTDIIGADRLFTPENQDKAALWLAQRDYGDRTGRDLMSDLKTEGMSRRIQSVLGPTWEAMSKGGWNERARVFSSTLGQGVPAPMQDDPSVPNTGPGMELAYRPSEPPPGGVSPSGGAGARIAAAIAPGASQAPAGAEVQQLVQAGILPEQLRPEYLDEMWRTQPTLRDRVSQWRASQGGAAPSPTPAAAVQRAAARASAPSGIQPRMRLSASDPLYSPAEIAAQNDGTTAADLPAQGGSLADLPAAGAQPSAFFVPPAKDGGEPTIVPAPGEGVKSVAAALAATGGLTPPPRSEGAVRVAQALTGGQDRAGARQAVIDMMTSPAASPRTQALGAALLQREVTEAQRGRWTMETLPDGTVGQRNSATDEFRVLRQGVSELDQQSKRLSIQKAQRELEEGKAPKTLTVKQPDGSDQILERQQDGSWSPIRMPPQDPNAPKASPKLTEAQSKDLVYFNRGIQALKEFEKDPNAYASTNERTAAHFLPAPLANSWTTDRFQMARQSGLNFLASILRKDSGAAITPAEEDLYGRMYLPQPNEKPGVLALKKEARRQAIEAIRDGLGTAEVLAKSKTFLDEPDGGRGGRGPASASSSAEPPRDRPVRLIPLTQDVAQRARDAIARGAPADKVKQRLQEGGYDASGL